MNRRFLLALAAAGIAAAAAGIYVPKLGGPENLSLQALSGDLLANSNDILVVDIRSEDEWKQTGVIEGAHLITYGGSERFLATVKTLLAPGQKLALVCRSGNRTSRATREIAGQMDIDVIDISGGMLRIMDEGYKTVAPTKALGCASCAS